MAVTTYEEAKELGMRRYNDGVPCKYGHDAPKYTSNKSCSECTTIRGQKRNRIPSDKVRVPQDEWDYQKELMNAFKEVWDE